MYTDNTIKSQDQGIPPSVQEDIEPNRRKVAPVLAMGRETTGNDNGQRSPPSPAVSSSR